jgi:acylglycerol lipase
MMREFNLISNNKNINIITHSINNPSCILIHIHGLCSNFQNDTYTMNDFKNRVTFLSKISILSYGLELEGHGKSEGTRGYIYEFDRLVSNFDSLFNFVKCEHPNIPVFVLAESMGAVVIIKSIIIINNYKLNGIILLSPYFKVCDNLMPSEFIQKIVCKLSYIFPTQKIAGDNKIDNWCSNKKYILLSSLNKYKYRGKFMLSTVREIHLNSLFVNENAHKVFTPILAIHSKDDSVTCYKGTINFINNIKSEDKEVFLLDKGNHTLLVPLDDNDYYPTIIMSKIVNWINKRI